MKWEIKMKNLLIAILVILLIIVIALVAGFFYLKSRFGVSGDTEIRDRYYEAFTSDAPLELKYAQPGKSEIGYTEFLSDHASIGKIRAWYPKELESSSRLWPMIVVVNASGTPAASYEPFFERLATWGFIVVGNEDPQAGSGETTSIMLDKMLTLDSDSVLYGKIDEENIGIIGYSQGGAGAICAVTNFENGSRYKAMFTGSAAYPTLAKNLGWGYDASKISIPYFMVAGTGKSDDSGTDPETNFGGVAPLSSLIANYNSISDDVPKLRARAVGAEHQQMLMRSDGYMTAWMLYFLQGDEEAGMVFLGEDAEILHNANWQDVEKSQ